MKVIFLAGHEFLSDKKNGGGHVSFRNYQLLSDIYGEENIYIVTFSNLEIESKACHAKTFPKNNSKLEYLFNYLGMRNGYGYHSEQAAVKYIIDLKPDMIFFDGSFTGTLLNKIIKKTGKKIVIVTFMHNVESRYLKVRFMHENFLYFLPFISYYYNEKILIKKSDVIIALNERDKEDVTKIYGRDIDYILPITYADAFYDKLDIINQDDCLNLLFLGSYFGPNIHGITWFAKEVMPKLPKNVILTIVGKDMENLKNKLTGNQVKVIGTVQDTSSYYQQADAVVLPIFYGSGMKVKTAEAMMYGKYILGTREAYEGYDTSGIDEMKECNCAEEFINQINVLFRQVQRQNYYHKVRQRFLDKYETRAVSEQFTSFMRKLTV